MIRILSNADNASHGSTHVIFIDKNHPNNGIDKAIDEVSDNVPEDTDLRVMYMIPSIKNGARIGGLPISASFMLQVFARAIFRDTHETLDNSDPVKILEIVNMFIGMLKDT
jgi:hypothetical protein